MKSKRYTYTRRCSLCGKFMSYSEGAYAWTPYGSMLDLEPPDEEYAHINCYISQPVEYIRLTERISWIKPRKIEECSCEVTSNSLSIDEKCKLHGH